MERARLRAYIPILIVTTLIAAFITAPIAATTMITVDKKVVTPDLQSTYSPISERLETLQRSNITMTLITMALTTKEALGRRSRK